MTTFATEITPSTPTASDPSAPARPFAMGDEVTIDHSRCHGHIYIVKHVKRTKASVRRKDAAPGERGIDAPMVLMAHYDPAVGTSTGLTQPSFTCGEVVRLKRAFRNNNTRTLMVVTRVNASSISLDPLGGAERGTPMRVAPGGIIKVNLDDVLA